MPLTGKGALITGGNRGIGFAIARKFSEQGARIAIAGRDGARAREAAESLGGGARWIQLDMRQAERFPEAIAEAAEALGGLDIVVNNAGVVPVTDRQGFFELTEADWDLALDTNLKGVFFLCREAAQWMMQTHTMGRIINICSNTAFSPQTMAYGISKWGVRGLTMGLGRYLAPKGILLNGIAPGPTSTGMMFSKEGETVLREDIPIGRYSYPDEIAALAAFLASDEVSNIAGEIIVADGGERPYL